MKIIFLAILAVIFIVCTTTLASAQATNISATFVSSFGNAGTGDGRLSHPQGIALDQSGNIYIADSENHRIAKFDSTGNFIAQIGVDSLSYPINVAVDKSGNIFVVDANNGIEKFNSSGNFVLKFGTYGMNEAHAKVPQGIAVDESGNIYITDFSNIAKYNSSGNFVSKFGTWGMKDGQLNSTGFMTMDNSGNIYVVDGNERIEKFSNDGTFIAKWGSYCTLNDYHTFAIYCHDPDGSGPLNVGDGQFSALLGIALDKFGNVFVTDYGNNRIQVFDTSGNFLYKFGSFGKDPNQFSGPNGIAADNSGNLYVVDQSNNRVQIFSIDYNSVASPSNDVITPPSPPTTATTSVFSSVNPSTFGQPVTFTATITPSSATETVQFAIDGANVGSPVTISGNTATLSNISNLSVGSHTITTTYSGDTGMLASTATLTQDVNPATMPSTTTQSTMPSSTPQSTTPSDAAQTTMQSTAQATTSSTTSQTTVSSNMTQDVTPTVTVQTPTPLTTLPLTSVPEVSSIQKIPNWVKGIFYYYGQGQISDSDLISAINFLIQQNIVQLKQ